MKQKNERCEMQTVMTLIFSVYCAFSFRLFASTFAFALAIALVVMAFQVIWHAP